MSQTLQPFPGPKELLGIAVWGCVHVREGVSTQALVTLVPLPPPQDTGWNQKWEENVGGPPSGNTFVLLRGAL